MALNNFAKNLKFLLGRNDVAIEELAFRAVVPLKYLIRYPTGQAEPNIRALLNLSDFFQVPLDTLIKADLEQAEKEAAEMQISMVCIDVDGVMTNGQVAISEKGDEIRSFNVTDGRAIMAMRKKGVHVGFVSNSDKDGAIKNWAEKLGVEFVYAGKDHKIEVIRKWCAKAGVELENVAFIGDDVNDIAAMRRVGLAVCPANAHLNVKFEAKILLEKSGGEGAVREFTERFVTPVES